MKLDGEVGVIGAGAAGLLAALRAAEGGARVVLIDSQSRIGAKILISGGGRCNVTNSDVTEAQFHTSGPRGVIRRALQQFTPVETLEFFDQLGVRLKLEPTGKYFPSSDRASTVLDALIDACQSAGVSLARGHAIRDLRPAEGGWRIESESKAWRVRSAVLTTGGLSLPRTGSNGYGYLLASRLGHGCVVTTPALTPLRSDAAWSAALRGVTLHVGLRLMVNGRRRAGYDGSFLFTHFGFSGPAALNLSRHWLRETGEQRLVLVRFLPDETDESLGKWWRHQIERAPRRGLANALAELMPARIGEVLCVMAGADPHARIGQVGRAERSRLMALLLACDLSVTGALGYEKAEATAGGIPLDEIDGSTMQSLKAPGLFFAGEILDVDGWLGGYNFQWAWSSGTVAGRSAARLTRA